jgi:hypothetical protein
MSETNAMPQQMTAIGPTLSNLPARPLRDGDYRALKAMLPLLEYRRDMLTRVIDALRELAATDAAATVAKAACEVIVAVTDRPAAAPTEER